MQTLFLGTVRKVAFWCLGFMIVFLGTGWALSFWKFMEIAVNWLGGNCGVSLSRGRMFLWNLDGVKHEKSVRYLVSPVSSFDFSVGPFAHPTIDVLGISYGTQPVPWLFGIPITFISVPLLYPL